MARDATRMTADDVELMKLKKYFRDVITNNDFNYEEYAQNTAKWLQLTGKDFEYDILLDKNKQDVLDVDDEIVANIEEIESVFDEDETKQKLDSIVDKTQKRVTIVDDDGSEVKKEQAHDLLSSLMLISKEEILAMYADDKEFARKSRQEKREALVSDVDVSFNLKAATAAAASAIDLEKDEDENVRRSQKVVADYMQGKNVIIKKDHIVNGLTKAVLKVKDKIAKFKEAGLIKSAAKIMKRVKGFKNWCKSKSIQIKDGFVRDLKVNATQWKARGATTATLIGATAFGGPVAALVAAGGVVAYEVLSNPLWLINSRRNYTQWLKQDDSYRGWAGFKKTWKEMRANPAEMKDYKRQCGISAAVAVASGGIVYALAPAVLAANTAAQTAATVAGQQAANTAAMGTVGLARVGTGLARVAGANANSLLAWYEADREYKKDPSEYNKQKLKAAKEAAIVTATATSLIEALAISHLNMDINNITGNHIDAMAHPTPDQASFGNWDSGNNIYDADSGRFAWQTNGAENAAGAASAGAEAAAASTSTPDVTFPEGYNSGMGITEKQWDILSNQKVTPFYVSNAEETYANAVNAAHAHSDIFANTDGSAMTPEQLWWKESRIMETLAKARPDGHGGLIARFWDPDGKEVFTNGDHNFFYDKAMTKPVDASIECLPRCNGDERTVKAFQQLYKMINCGEDVKNVDATRIKQFFDETTASGQYKGAGWDIGQTHNYADRDGCEDIHWILGRKSAPVRAPAPEPDPLPTPDPAPTPAPAPAPAPEPAPAPVNGPALQTDEEVAKVNKVNVTNEGGTPNHSGGARTAGGRTTTHSGGQGNITQGTLNGSKVTTPGVYNNGGRTL